MYSIYSYLLKTKKDMITKQESTNFSEVANKEELGYDDETCFEKSNQDNSYRLQKYRNRTSIKTIVFVVLTIILIKLVM